MQVLTGLRLEKQRLGRLKSAREAARRSLLLARRQYEDGLVSFDRVLSAQRALLRTEDQVTLSESTLARQFVALARSLGGSWQQLDTELAARS